VFLYFSEEILIWTAGNKRYKYLKIRLLNPKFCISKVEFEIKERYLDRKWVILMLLQKNLNRYCSGS